MPKLVLSSRAIQVINKSIDLFHHRGFHTVGVDRIVKECEITKATFYNFFHSKERFIEICLIVQKERLKEKWSQLLSTPKTQARPINSNSFISYIPM